MVSPADFARATAPEGDVLSALDPRPLRLPPSPVCGLALFGLFALFVSEAFSPIDRCCTVSSGNAEAVLVGVCDGNWGPF